MKYRVQVEKIESGYVEVYADSAKEAYAIAGDFWNLPDFQPNYDRLELVQLPSYEDDFSDRVEEIEE